MRYKVFYLAGIALAAALCAGGAIAKSAQQPAAHDPLQKHWGMFEEYCNECHNITDWAGSIAFDTMEPQNVGKDADVWENVVRKLRGRMMPPPGKKRPNAAATEQLVAALEGSLDRAVAERPNPGTVQLHRLNRSEYEAAIADILGIKIDATSLLPRDDKSAGFNNIAEVLKVSPVFVEQYMNAARLLTIQALGDPAARIGAAVYRGSMQARQYMHMEGLPLGTRGGLLIEHNFPADGEYDFTVNGLVGAGYVWGVMDPNTLIITIDDQKVFEQSLGGAADLDAVDLQQATGVAAINGRFKNIRRNVKAGPHRIGVTFLEKTAAEHNGILHAFAPVIGMGAQADGNTDAGPRIASVEIRGPFNVTGVSETLSRKKILTCRPANVAEEPHCANLILAGAARKAYRREVTADDLKGPLKFYTEGRAAGDFESGIQKGLMAILSSPKFLFRSHGAVEPGVSPKVLSDRDLASRLSFFIWGGLPDDELLRLAAQGRLHEPAMLEKQVRRMLADARSRALVTNFAFQWLNVHGLRLVNTDLNLFPEFTPDLIEAFERELELFIGNIFEHDRSVVDLLTDDHSFLNERLALHYGVNGVRGGQFREVVMTDSYRRGLLGKGAFLMATSYANRTTPVLRGVFVLEKLLGSPPAAPPPNVQPFPETKDGGVALSVRARMEAHREKPSCNACHAVIDPVGLALENLNAVGQWQDKDRDAGTLIDAFGQMVDGTPLPGPDGLRKAILDRSNQFVQSFTENLLTYALGRTLKSYDMPTVRGIVKGAAKDNYRLSAIVLGIVNSDAFKSDSGVAVVPKEQTADNSSTAR